MQRLTESACLRPLDRLERVAVLRAKVLHAVLLVVFADARHSRGSTLRPSLARDTHSRGPSGHLLVRSVLPLLVPLVEHLSDCRRETLVVERETVLDPAEFGHMVVRAARVALNDSVALEAEGMLNLAAPNARVLDESAARRGRRHGRALGRRDRAERCTGIDLAEVCFGEHRAANAAFRRTPQLSSVRPL